MATTHPLTAGISLIETVIALLILSVIGVAIVGLTIQIGAASTSASLRSQAASYAEQALEQARGYYQANRFQSTLAKVCAGGCYADGYLSSCGAAAASCVSSCTTGYAIAATPFYRSVQVSQVSSAQIRVSAKVAWMDRSKCQTIALDTYFYNY